MKKTGKWLERLVASVESGLISDPNASIKSNIRKYGANRQVAEFDLVITTKAGSTPIAILIECRDRSQKANTQWIEALIGRRLVHGFTKVCAVSTSGFSPGREELARRFDVECKTVADITPSSVLGLLAETPLRFGYYIKKPEGKRIDCTVYLPKAASIEDRASALAFLKSIPSDSPVIRVLPNDELLTFTQILDRQAIQPPEVDPTFEGTVSLGEQRLGLRCKEGQRWILESDSQRWPVDVIHYRFEPIYIQELVKGIGHLVSGSQGKVAEVVRYRVPFFSQPTEMSLIAIPQEDGSSSISCSFKKLDD